jgi:hypothetical protein
MPTPLVTFIADPYEPDLYNDVTDLPSPFSMNIPIGIGNTHTIPLWYRVSLVAPPAAYTIYTQNLGTVNASSSAIFGLILNRNMPTLTAGEYDETLTFRVDAYTDSGYSVAYANQTLSVNVHHFNHADASWAVLVHSTFDDGTLQGWSTDPSNPVIGSGSCMCYPTTVLVLSTPYSLQSSTDPGKIKRSVNTSAYSKARVVFHVIETSSAPPTPHSFSAIQVDSVLKKPIVLSLAAHKWCRLAYNVPIGTSKEIAFGGISGYYEYVFFDEIWVIAK